MNNIKKIINDYSVSHLLAGVITILVGYAASVALIFQAAQAAGADLQQATSWIFAVCMSMGLTSIVFSLYWKMPVVTAWSTPGVVLLISTLSGITLSQTIGVFVFVSCLTILVGATGFFEKIIKHVPMELASALLAGILVQLTINIFSFFKVQPLLVGTLFSTFWFFKFLNSRYTMVMVVLSGVTVSLLTGLMKIDAFPLELVKPVFIQPEFNFKVLMSIGIPLFLVTMTGQNIPGYTIAKANGYELPVSKVVAGMGIFQFIFSFFGCFSTNLAALTAAIAMNKEVHVDPDKRYLATVTSGLLSVIIALFAGSVAYLLNLFPKELILTIAGLALVGTTTQSIKSAFEKKEQTEIMFIIFCIAASGVNIGGLSSAFWSFIVGLILFKIFKRTAPLSP